MNHRAILGLSCLLLSLRGGHSAPPGIINFQGRVISAGAVFSGAGQFKFALLSADGTNSYWQNSADANSDGVPDSAVTSNVDRGLYSILLGDNGIVNMAALPASVFTNDAVFLRVWFSDGAHGFQKLSPDQRVTASGYALMASTVPDGSITEAKFAPSALAGLNAHIDSLVTNISGLSNEVKSIGAFANTAVSSDPADPSLLQNGFRRFNTVAAPAWKAGSAVDAPSARYSHSAVWTGNSFVVWGGNVGGQESQQGGGYDPVLDAWTAVSTISAPAKRMAHTAVWTGDRMIVWGGNSGGAFLNTGGVWNAAANTWSATSTTASPDGRQGHIAVWTGSKMFIWGGQNSSGLLNDGALYDPVANSWTSLALADAPEARIGATAIWAGDRVLIWGGEGSLGVVGSGAELIFNNGVPTQWTAISNSNSPAARNGHSAIWTGSKMIVWGGSNGAVFGNGGIFDPVANSWSVISANAVADARTLHSAVWSGDEMLILGGQNNSTALSKGAAFNPLTGVWRSLTGAGSPAARAEATAAWTGSEIVIFGGRANGVPVAALQRLDPQPDWHFYRKL